MIEKNEIYNITYSKGKDGRWEGLKKAPRGVL